MTEEPTTLGAPAMHLGDNYSMKQALATGGAARIYLATQISLDREVVVKVLRNQLSTQPEFRQRFAAEARLLARLAHPNIVQIIDFGDQESGYYFIMEYIRGGSLKDLLDRADHIPIDVALSIAYFVVRGLSYVHEHQVLHLDIKPANILLTRHGVIKVADFGLARLCEEGLEEKRRGHPAGTPLYMSPEQVAGAQLDLRSDLFSFGVLLYQLLTYRNPFQGRSTDEVYRLIRACRVRPPSELRSEIPAQLDNVVMTCLNRDTERRYESASALLAELHTVLELLGIHQPEERIRTFLSSPANYRTVLKRSSLRHREPESQAGRRLWLKAFAMVMVAGGLLATEAWLLERLLPKIQGLF